MSMKYGKTKCDSLSQIGHHGKWMRTWPFQKWQWNGMLNLDESFPFLGYISVWGVGWESYGKALVGCSVLGTGTRITWGT
jgi:hypothetical protein